MENSDLTFETNGPELILTRGISNSGKSTFARQWVAEDPANRRRVNRDDIRAAGGVYVDEFSRETEEMVSLFQQSMATFHLRAGRSVIIDDTNLRAKYVHLFYQLAKSLNVKFRVIPFSVSLEEALSRNKKRGATGGLFINPDVIERMYHNQTRKGVPHPLPDFERVEQTKQQNNSRKSILVNPEIYVPNPELPKAVIADLDGTLTTGIHPDRGPFEWAKVGLDEPNEHLIDILRYLHADGYKILITSGREDESETESRLWLERHGIPYDDIFMRKTGDRERDDVVKLEIFNREIRNNYNIRAVFDDRGRVVRAWHAIGLPLFRVGDPFSDF